MKTNAEKYEEVFGFPPRTDKCPSEFCCKCPLKFYGIKRECHTIRIREWWNSEYKESEDEK